MVDIFRKADRMSTLWPRPLQPDGRVGDLMMTLKPKRIHRPSGEENGARYLTEGRERRQLDLIQWAHEKLRAGAGSLAAIPL